MTVAVKTGPNSSLWLAGCDIASAAATPKQHAMAFARTVAAGRGQGKQPLVVWQGCQTEKAAQTEGEPRSLETQRCHCHFAGLRTMPCHLISSANVSHSKAVVYVVLEPFLCFAGFNITLAATAREPCDWLHDRVVSLPVCTVIPFGSVISRDSNPTSASTSTSRQLHLSRRTAMSLQLAS